MGSVQQTRNTDFIGRVQTSGDTGYTLLLSCFQGVCTYVLCFAKLLVLWIGLHVRKVLKCAFAYDLTDCPEVTPCG